MNKSPLIRPKNKYWRYTEPLCGIINEWHGKRKGARVIEKLTTQPQLLQELIDKVIERDSSPAAIELQKVKIAWEKILPIEYSKTAFPYYIKNKVLFVKVHDSCSLMELKMMSPKILKMLSEKIKEPKFSKIAFLS